MINDVMTASLRMTLKKHGLKDTQPRRFVLQALEELKKPASPYDIRKWVDAKGGAINAVTIYRIIEVFIRIGLVHRHPCDGGYFLCSLPHEKGHHNFLHCTSCGMIREFHDTELCKAEERIARTMKFRSSTHINEIIGTCADCTQ